MQFQIFIMYVNGIELLINAVTSIRGFEERIVVLDNSDNQDLQPADLNLSAFVGEIYKPPVPLFVNQSYNLISKLAQERNLDVFFMMHSDGQASDGVIKRMLAHAQELNNSGQRWSVLFTDYDVVSLWNTSVIRNYSWDRYLPVSYVDVDMYYQLRRDGVQPLETHLIVDHVQGGSSTTKADLALSQFIRTNYSAWRNYYIAKWGGDRDHELFTAPFDT